MIAGPDGSPPRIASLGELLRVALVGVGLVLLPTCARPGQPPGGPRDVLPPQVVSTSPEGRELNHPADEPVVLRFNETLSERPVSGRFEDAVIVIPEVPGVRISHGGDRITVRPPGDWRSQQVYRIRVRPVLQDRFNNRMAQPFELVFGVGTNFPDGVIAGVVRDRLTLQPVQGVRVTALDPREFLEDRPLYPEVTDSAGIFSWRYMVGGDYEIVAFTDQNRNREPDPFEQIGRTRVTLSTERPDTVVTALTILTPDTTPARVASMELADSAAIRVTLDDYLDPEVALDGVVVEIASDSAPNPGVREVVHPRRYERMLAEREALAAAAADTTGQTEPAEVPPDTTTPLPRRQFIVITIDSLRFDAPYVVRVQGVTNINGVPGGTGADTIVRPAPEPVESPGETPSDSLAAPPDTGGVTRR